MWNSRRLEHSVTLVEVRVAAAIDNLRGTVDKTPLVPLETHAHFPALSANVAEMGAAATT